MTLLIQTSMTIKFIEELQSQPESPIYENLTRNVTIEGKVDRDWDHIQWLHNDTLVCTMLRPENSSDKIECHMSVHCCLSLTGGVYDDPKKVSLVFDEFYGSADGPWTAFVYDKQNESTNDTINVYEAKEAETEILGRFACE